MIVPRKRWLLLSTLLLLWSVPAATAGDSGGKESVAEVSILESSHHGGSRVEVSVTIPGYESVYAIASITDGVDPIPQVVLKITDGVDPIPQVKLTFAGDITEGPDPIPQLKAAVHVGITDGADPILTVSIAIGTVDH